MSYGYTEHICATCNDRFVTDYHVPLGHEYLDVRVEATPDSVGYTRHICIRCNYSYISDIVTSGDTGYIPEPVEPAEPHSHAYQLYVQDYTEGKFFIALRVCNCGDVKSGGLVIRGTKDGSSYTMLQANEYGQVFYSDLNTRYKVEIADERGNVLKTFWLTSRGISEQAPAEPDEPVNPGQQTKPDDPVNPGQQTKPDDPANPGEQTQPDDPTKPDEPTQPNEPTQPDTPDNPDDPNEPENPDEGEQKSNKGVTSMILFVVLIVLAGGGLAAYFIIKKKKKKDQK